ncbi:MAG: hypothetical protein RhofKO_21900 [Rhodothermales bacterium]
MLDHFAHLDAESALRRLHKLLAFGGVGPWIVVPLLFLSYSSGLYLVKVALVLAVPYLAWLLWHAEWKGWLVGLLLVSVVPMLLFWSLTPTGYVAGLVFDAVPLISTLCLTSLLQSTVAEWLHDREWQHRFQQEDLRAKPQRTTQSA